MTTDTPLNLNKPTMDLADLRHKTGKCSRFRTRRPLPPVVDQTQSQWFTASMAKAEATEMKPVIMNRSQESHSVKWVPANPPLEKELEYLTKEASRAADIHTHVVIVDCLRYLRDEIQKLKDAR
jgi:hypothetical protein